MREQEVLLSVHFGFASLFSPSKKAPRLAVPMVTHTKLWQVKFQLSTLFASLTLNPLYLYCTRVLYDFGDKKWTQRVSHTKMVIFKRCLLAIITFEKSRDFFRYDSTV